ncbi:hypothetical protein EMIT047CA2_10278 [Pseudomonas soli]
MPGSPGIFLPVVCRFAPGKRFLCPDRDVGRKLTSHWAFLVLCFFCERARMRAEGAGRVVHTLRYPLLGLPIACGQQGFKRFCQALPGARPAGCQAPHEGVDTQGSGQSTAS